MSYVYSYCVASIVFLSINVYFYFTNSRIHNFEDKFFIYLICSSMIALIFDLLGALSDVDPAMLPLWAKYAVNILGIGATHFCYPCFCLYLFKANDERKFITPFGYFATFIPYGILLALLLISPTTPYGLFYIDEAGVYCRGTTYIALYFSSVIYYVTAFVLVIVYYRKMETYRNRLILLSFAIIIVAAALQYFLPNYLLITSATALSVAIIHLTLQNPVDRIDPLTGAFNRTQLIKLLRRYQERHSSYTLLLFSVGLPGEQGELSISDITALMLHNAADFLKSYFNKDAVVYMDSMDFAVVCQRNVSPTEIRRTREGFARKFGTDAHTSPPRLNAAVLHSEEQADSEEMLALLDRLFKRMKSGKQDNVLVADAGFRQECYEDTILSGSISKLLNDENASLGLCEQYDSGGSVARYRAFLSISAEGIGEVYGEKLLQKADEAGLAWTYFSLLLEKLAERVGELSPGCLIEIEIPISICLSKDAAAIIDRQVHAAGMQPSQLAFSMKESEIINAQENVRKNIVETAALGYTLRVTDFATGATNIALLIKMPVDEIELNASDEPGKYVSGQDKMFQAVIGMLKGMDKVVVCSGVTSKEQAQKLFGYGADLIEH